MLIKWLIFQVQIYEVCVCVHVCLSVRKGIHFLSVTDTLGISSQAVQNFPSFSTEKCQLPEKFLNLRQTKTVSYPRHRSLCHLILSDATMNCYRAFFPSIVPVLLKCNWGKTLCKFWVCNVLIWYNVIQYHIDTAMWSLAWHQLIPPSCHIIAISFFLWWELLRCTVSVTFKYVVGQYMRSPELIHLLSRNLYLLTNISPFLSSSSL